MSRSTPPSARPASAKTHRQEPSRARFERFRQAYATGDVRSYTHDEESEAPSAAKASDQKKDRHGNDERRRYLRLYLAWLWPHRGAILLMMGLALAVATLEVAQPLFMRYVVDDVLLREGLTRAERLARLHVAGAVLLVVVLSDRLLDIWKNCQQRLLNLRVVLSLRRALFGRLLRLPLGKLNDMKTGGILSRLSGDIDRTTGLMQLAVISPAVSLARLLIAVGILLAVNWRLALTAMTVIPPAMLISMWVARRIRPIYRSMRKENSEIDARVSETFGGIRVVRSFQRETRELAGFLVGRHTIARKELFAHRREIVLWSSWALILATVNVVIIWYGGFLQLAGSATVGDIMAFQWYTFMLLNPVWQIVNSFSEMQRSLAGMERVFEVLESSEDKPDRPGALEAPRHVDEIRFEDVTFAYNDGVPVLHAFNLTAPGGSVIALVGRSGAGKTTVTDLVARFYDPTEGRVTLNGIDLRDLRLDSYRSLLGVVQQETFLFDGSVRDNIAYGRRHASDAEVIEAARAANAHEFITDLPAGYDSLIGERGVRLSGGQAQRLSIARAILANPRILILDEATSNLDSESEQLIQQSLDTLMHTRTTFVIAHRLSTVAQADEIVVLDEGRIVQRGKHEELMRRGGPYREMVARQRDAMSDGAALTIG
ncbi:ABC transporter ATP-binding protein [Botrimarina hoheduenensis]|uniref:Putative multidrug export ATP-binding/permease protein n=1 Tax=Botrimarina hoheduenensis TaxID=2528000 RepID=A0A5C5VU05_9BACT|nr:ABC transporter ATP-binding protein [Botrimarina hoheduenensis]TWT41623.1 putative multidrug export ATP-binding/permease protein [Botrimarina hoheduenensis]